MAINSLLLAALASSASAATLFAASYAGTVTTLDLRDSSLEPISVSKDCGYAPSWLTKESPNFQRPVLYCVDEDKSLNTLSIARDGSLKKIDSRLTVPGAVSSQFYNSGTKSAVAVASYGGSGITTFLRTVDGKLTPLQNITFETAPGPRPEQDKSHVHQAIIDPSKKFLLFPDLGADLVRIYSFDKATSLLKEESPIKSDLASGPRHAVFWSPSTRAGAPLYLFVIHELANFIRSYSVSYPAAGGMAFTKIQDITLFPGNTIAEGARAAEILVSPDNRFILASNRNSTLYNLPNPDSKNSTTIPSDSITSFKPSADGKLAFLQIAPSGGKFPRHFSLNKAGDKVAVANQNSEQVTVWKRDVRSGRLGDRVAVTGPMGLVTMVIWNE
ncbi:putative isomerase YbhE [Delitschia confertaspora ATCC 74209]|uniref:Isomerase YbhE n=1 Tax=Delitschia confertaspora ATCC 74209 TaxID=1513339 RepID=A0A9P4JH41_9PLEO|nr:putative isomerase YbhE [Delitschia confertaspora ATCC 74209]